MTKQKFPDRGFQYRQRLCEAIESFTRDAELSDPLAFMYRGANLRYAVERYLYFSFVINKNLYKIFCQWASERVPQRVWVRSQLEKDLAGYLTKGGLSPSRLKINLLYQGLAHPFLSDTRRKLKNLYRGLFLKRKSFSKWEEERSDVLIFTRHIKFAKYISPILEHLSSSFAYLTLMNKGLNALLAEKGLPFIGMDHLKAHLENEPSSQMVSKFRHLAAYYDCFYENVKSLRPKCVIVIEGNAPEDEVINQACQQLSIPVICLQNGWFAFMHNGFRNMSYTKMLVWGEGFAELLQPYNPEQKFVSVGSHVLCSESPSRPSDKHQRGICFFMQSPEGAHLLTPKGWGEFLRLIELTADESRRTLIIIREHPGYSLKGHQREKLEKFENVRFMPSKDYSLKEVFSQICLSVSIYSSTILESIAAGVVPLVFNMTSLPMYFPDVHAAGAGVEVKDIEAAREIIRCAISDEMYIERFQPAMQKFREKYFYAGDQSSVSKIADEIFSLTRTEPDTNKVLV